MAGIGGAWSLATSDSIPLAVMLDIGLIDCELSQLARQWSAPSSSNSGGSSGCGAGCFRIVRFIDKCPRAFNQRTITTSFAAEQTSHVRHGACECRRGPVLDGARCAEGRARGAGLVQAVSWAAQTALRDIIGRTALSYFLRGREQIEAELQQRSISRSIRGRHRLILEMRDVVIPVACKMPCRERPRPPRKAVVGLFLPRRNWKIAHLFAEAAK